MPRIALSAEEETLNLTESVGLANDYGGPETTWKGKRYGPDEAVQFRRMLHALQEWREAGLRNIGFMKLERKDRKNLEKYAKQIRLVAERNGSYSVIYPTPWNEAVFQFNLLLSNGLIDRLGGPCRNRRKHEDRDYWFVRATRRQSVFCSRRCAGDATKANERRRAYNARVEKAKRAIRNYPTRPSRFKELGWKEYVIKAEPSLTKRFLTMAVEGGYLVPPDSR